MYEAAAALGWLGEAPNNIAGQSIISNYWPFVVRRKSCALYYGLVLIFGGKAANFLIKTFREHKVKVNSPVVHRRANKLSTYTVKPKMMHLNQNNTKL